MPDSEQSVDRLLRSREARGLVWSIVARLGYILLAAAVIVSAATSFRPVAGVLGLLGAGAVLSVFCFSLARREKRLRFVGIAGMSFDCIVLFVVPIAQYEALGGLAVSPAVLMKNDIILVSLMLVIINSLALKPLYPAIVAAASAVLHVGLAAFALSDPRVVLTTDTIETLIGSGVNLGVHVWLIITIALAGLFLSWSAATSRKTIRDAIELEIANRRIRENQAQLLMQSRIAGVTSLVAGIVHEMNTPLGAVVSAGTTAEKSAGRIAELLKSDDGAAAAGDKAERLLGALVQSSRAAKEGARRLSEMLASLENFASLDQAEVQKVNLQEAVENTLNLIPPSVKGGSRVVLEFEAVPELECRPRELSQVFHALFLHSFEAMGGAGTLSIRGSHPDEAIAIEIRDTSSGMLPGEAAGLFDIDFAESSGRVGVRLGLPAARVMVDRAGGTLSATSEPGKGTTFRMVLPIDGDRTQRDQVDSPQGTRRSGK